jgi:hypothetical protein
MVITINYKDELPKGFIEINCTSRGNDRWKELSPFMNRSVTNPEGIVSHNMENLWQFSKVYKSHLDENGSIKMDYFRWRLKGFNSKFAQRYPMGKGAKPEFLLWGDDRLSYIQARESVYFPKYAESIQGSEVFNDLVKIYRSGANLAIRDFDVYRFDPTKTTIEDIIKNPNKKAGHGFVLYKMLRDLN